MANSGTSLLKRLLAPGRVGEYNSIVKRILRPPWYQFLQCCFLAGSALVVKTAVAQSWTQNTNSPSYQWQSIASSANGATLVAVSDGPIYCSTNSGLIWHSNGAPRQNWASVACSADGVKMIAASGQWQTGAVYISTNSGVTWDPSGLPVDYWSSVACSADGLRFAAASGYVVPGNIYLSTNSGSNWERADAPTNNYWTGIASSADGSKLVASSFGSNLLSGGWFIYRSTNFGASWTPTGAPLALWSCVASSTDGNILLAGAGIPGALPGPVCTSTNAGTTWVSNNLPVTKWVSVAVSADGRNLMALVESGMVIYKSNDSGITWVSNQISSMPGLTAAGCAASADAHRLVVTSGNRLFNLQSTPAPMLRIASRTSEATLSWMVPSAAFVLQENVDLTTSNWIDSLASPILDYTTLEYRVTEGAATTQNFFRLLSR
jgi:hypothetical protein